MPNKDWAALWLTTANKASRPVPVKAVSYPYADKAFPRSHWIWGSSSMIRIRGLVILRALAGG